MRDRYRPQTLDQKIGYLVEEAGEVMAAAGKSIRWGLAGFNPEVPMDKRETNADWLLRELRDLRDAILMAEIAIEDWKQNPQETRVQPDTGKNGLSESRKKEA